MKTCLRMPTVVALCIGLHSASAQFGPPGGMPGTAGPKFDAAMIKLFGENKAFSAEMELHAKGPRGENMVVPGKISFDNGLSRFEMDTTKVQGSGMPPEQTAQLTSFGMGSMVIVSRPDKKTSFMIYPGMEAYLVVPQREQSSSTNDSFKMELTEEGKETVQGHACIKNKAVVTDDTGKQHESTIWNATDLNNFPIKIETADNGQRVAMIFDKVKLAKPAQTSFDEPAKYKRYESFQMLLQQEIMKRMGAGQ